VTLALAFVGAAGSASAAPTAADRETARTLMDQGREFRDKGDMKEALKRFQAANDIMHVPTTALEVAKAQVALGLLVEARDTVAGLRQIPSKADSPLFKDARRKAEELDGSLEGRVPSLSIVLKGAGQGEEAVVSVDGVQIPTAALGLPRSVDPGHHVVTAKAQSAEGKQEVDVKESEHKPVEVAMIATSAPAAAAETPEPTPEDSTPKKKSHGPTTLTWVGVGVAGAGAIAGGVTGILSISKKGSLVSECPHQVCGPASYSTLDSANLLATLSDVTFGVAGAGAVLAVVTLVVGHEPKNAAPPPPSAGFTVTPWLAGGAAGLRGTF